MRSLRSASLVLSAVLALTLSGCGNSNGTCKGRCAGGGDGGPNGDGGTNGGLTITPAQAALTVQGAAATQQFVATDLGGHDVTSKCTWSASDATLGSISKGGLFTTAYPLAAGGVETITASYGGDSGAASVTIAYVAPDVVDPSAGGGATGAFGGPASTDPSETPQVVYPFDGTMLARNIGQMDLQWQASPKDVYFKIRVSGPTIDQSFYVGQPLCAGGTQCQYTFADKDWQRIAQSASGAAVKLTIAATAGPNQPVATTPPMKLHFSPDDVKGGIYYFSTSIAGIKRVPFGAKTATDFILHGNGYSADGDPAHGCAGCHSISRDGKKVAATFLGGDGAAGIVDGANGQSYLLPVDTSRSKYAWNFATFSPDGTQMVTNWSGRLSLRDASTGALLKDIPPSLYGGDKEAVMPEWSPDGNSIVFIGIPQSGYIGKEMTQNPYLMAGDWILGNAGDVMVMPVNGGSFGMATAVAPSVPMASYNFYPSWSPDSQWIVFATGTYPGSSPTAANNGVDTTDKCMSYDQDTARLRMVRATGGAIIELTNATHVLNHTSSWPKFAPFLQQQGNLVFFTFAAKFAYGFVVPEGMRPQLWMSAVDLAKAQAGGADPSFPPFWLPFQDDQQNNHSAVWTTDVACTGNGTGQCPAEFTCQNGMCVPGIG